ncbi:potassium voltage-gated channel subfamily H member 8-like, partial [Olea europaea subsp. europaea]
RDALNYLYLVCNGSMEVLQDNMVVAILGKGDLVGYDVNAVITPDHTQYGGLNKVGSMLGPPMSHGLVKSSSDLKALTYCDLKCIHISGLLDVLKLYPEFSDTFHREIIHDLSFNLRENHDEQTDEMTDDEEANGLGSPPIDDGYGGGGGNGAGGTRGNGAGGGSIGGGNGARRSPPPNIGHLYRSITSGENQIGRYDHLEEDAAGEEADEDEEEEEDDEEEEEDDEEEEEEEDGDDDDDDEDEEDENDEPEEGDGEEEEPDEGGGGKTGSGRNNNSTPNRQQQQQPGGTRTKEGPVEGTNPTPNERLTNGLTNSVTNQRHKTSSGRSLNELHNQRDDSRTSLNNWQHHHGGKSISDEELSSSIKTEVEASGDLAPDQMNPVANLRRRMIRAQEDCQSAHSYDGLMERTRRRRQVNANTEVARKIIKNNSSDTVVELINSGGSSIMSPTTRSLQHPQAHNTNSHPTSSRLRSASRVPGSIGSRKPPLSFDLSRNTTAIVDRRRRSAGCIPRTLLMGAVAAAAAAANNNSLPARANHSSLLHINEEPTSSSNSASNNHGNNKRTAASSRKSTALNRKNASAARSSGCEVDLNNTNYSSQDLKNIDARISGISASVREMKQELRVEMSQFRATVQLLMQLVDKQVAAPGKGGVSTRETTNNNESSGKTLVRSSSSLHSIANCSTNRLSALERRQNSCAKSRRNSNSNNKHSNKQQATGSALCLKTPIIKSLSAVGLSTTFNATNTTTTTTSVDPSSAAGYFQQQQQQQTSSKVQEAKSGQDQSNSMITTTTTTNSAQKASGLGEGGAEQVISSSSLSLSSSSSLQPIGTSVRLNKPTTTVTTITKVNTLLPENGSTFSSSKDSSNSGVQLAQVSASLNQVNPTLPHPLTPFATTNNANNPLDSNLQRPISQCSSPVTSDFRQSSSGANLNNHSDNDSGRSSSSVNSSSNNFLTRSNGGGAISEQAQLPLSNSTLMTKQQLVVQTSSSSAISSRNQPITQLSSPAPQSPPNLIGGRPAKMFLTEAGANHLRRYTIDIGDENNNEPELKSSKIISNEESNGSSIV